MDGTTKIAVELLNANGHYRASSVLALAEDVKHQRDQLSQLVNALRIESATMREAVAKRTAERDAYKTACERAGVCMTCVVQAPEPYGCSDCLNTGWAQGEPVAPLVRRAEASDGLLDALREIAEIPPSYSGNNSHVMVARAAIAKAVGTA